MIKKNGMRLLCVSMIAVMMLCNTVEAAQATGTSALNELTMEESVISETEVDISEPEVSETEDFANEESENEDDDINEVNDEESQEVSVENSDEGVSEESGLNNLEPDAITAGDFSYTTSGSNATITSYTGTNSKVIVPEEIDGYSVTSIGSRAFYNCTSLTEITFPDSLKSINANSFYGCSSLKAVEIPSNVTSISSSAFPLVETVVFKEGRTTIPSSVFSGNSNLKSVSLPSGLTSIGSSAFSGCSSLTGITFPDSLKQINTRAFQNCTSIESVTLPSSIESIGSNAFSGCSLTKITIPSSVNGMGAEAFSSVESVVFEDGMTTIPGNACNGCKKITSVSIPNSVTSIGGYAFRYCEALTEFDIPETVTKIGTYAFSGSKINSVAIGNGVTIESSAFYNCVSLEKITLGNGNVLKGSVFRGCTAVNQLSLGDGCSFNANDFPFLTLSGELESGVSWKMKSIQDGVLEFSGNGEIPDFESSDDTPWYLLKAFVTSIDISDGITSIGSYAFADLSKLEYFFCGGSVTEIHSYAVKNATKLTGVELSEKLARIDENAFENCPGIKEIIFHADDTAIAPGAFSSEAAAKVFIPFTGVGYTNYVRSKFPQMIWRTYDNTADSYNIVLVLDKSSSMSGRRIANLKEAAKKFVSGVGGIEKNTHITLIEYDSTAKVLLSETPFTDALESKIDSLKANGGTEYKKALSCADEKLANSKATKDVVVLFSDGEPNDSKDAIRALAAEMQGRYTMFTVGLGTSASQRQILIDVAGSEDRYFEAADIDGLINAFKDLGNNIGKEAYSQAKIHRNAVWHDLRSEVVKYVKDSKEDATIDVIPSNKYKGELTYSLYQGKTLLEENKTGEFFVVPGKYNLNTTGAGAITSLGRIKIVISDADGKELETIYTAIKIIDGFTITYMSNYDSYNSAMTSKVIHTQKVKPWDDFDYDGDDPVWIRHYFNGWYEVKTPAQYDNDYFSFLYSKDRYCIEDDKILYASWNDTQIDMYYDIWGINNGDHHFTPNSTYDIRDEDFDFLVANNSRWWDLSQRKAYKSLRATSWCGSCFSLAATTLLDRKGMLNFDRFASDANLTKISQLTDLDKTIISKEESLINYYYLLVMEKHIKKVWSEYDNVDEDKNIRQIIDKAKPGEPVVLFVKLIGVGSHAVALFDFHEISEGKYSALIYDNAFQSTNTSDDSQKAYKITFEENNGKYTWSEDANNPWPWTCQKYLMSAITLDEILSSITLLEEPQLSVSSVGGNSIDDVTGAEDDEEDDDDCISLTTNYENFVISNGEASAVVKNGELTDNSLNIDSMGLVNFVGAEREYGFRLPVLQENGKYEIYNQAGEVEQYKTVLSYSKRNDGFYYVANAEGSGKVSINEDGRFATEFDSSVSQNIEATSNKLTTRWYDLSVSGENHGYILVPQSNGFKVSALDSKDAEISVSGTINGVDFGSVPVDSDGVTVVQNGENCEVSADDSVLSTKKLGCSVIFVTQGGTSIETLNNVERGSLVEEPEAPVWSGYTFVGWFKDKECTAEWNFATDTVEEDTKIYAGWSLNPNYLSNVSFYISEDDCQTIHVKRGTKLTPEMCPVIPGKTDQIWYIDRECTEAWDFENNIVAGNMTLYGNVRDYSADFDKWLKSIMQTSDTSFEVNVATGEKITIPELARGTSSKSAYKIKYATTADKKKATLSSKGLLCAKRVGESNITVEKDGVIYSVTVSIYNPQFKYEDPRNKKYVMNVGDEITPAYEDCELRSSFYVSGKHKTYAEVDPDNGKVTALKKGKVKLYAKVGNGNVSHIASATVIIYNPEIVGKDSVKAGRSIKLKIRNGSKGTTWRTENARIATVDSKGRVKGVAKGTVRIFAVNNGKEIYKEVTVK